MREIPISNSGDDVCLITKDQIAEWLYTDHHNCEHTRVVLRGREGQEYAGQFSGIFRAVPFGFAFFVHLDLSRKHDDKIAVYCLLRD